MSQRQPVVKLWVEAEVVVAVLDQAARRVLLQTAEGS
jgi:hypothetical protein